MYGMLVGIATERAKHLSLKRKSPMKMNKLLLFIVLVFGVSIEAQIGSNGETWYEALAGFQWRF
jgi:hypothetical protein